MKRLFLLSLGVFASSMVVAQTVTVDVTQHECKIVNDSLIIQMSISGNIDELNSRDAVVLTPYLSSHDEGIDINLPFIQFNGKYKQILYVRNKQIRNRMKSDDNTSVNNVQALNSNGNFSVNYRAAVAIESISSGDIALQIRCENVNVDNETNELSNTFVEEIKGSKPKPSTNVHTQPKRASKTETDYSSKRIVLSKVDTYKGTYVAPETDATDERNQRDLNFSLEEAQIMVGINPQILSLKELFTVAMSYKEDKEKFYDIISTCVKLYPTHPIANLNAASMAIEQGDRVAANKYLQIAPYESLAYKNCRGAYELMNGNVYEGIRLLKSAKAEGSEEAGYNLDLFFKLNK
ncbi:MAG: DUF3868 domain-containing protein [Rikenellaceae bacterium]